MDIKASLEDMGYSVTSLAASGTQAIEEADLLCGQIRALIDAVDEVLGADGVPTATFSLPTRSASRAPWPTGRYRSRFLSVLPHT